MTRVSPTHLAVALAFTGAVLSGCGGFSLRPVTPQSQPGTVLATGHVASVQVLLAPELEADKVQMLVNNDVPGEMARVLTGIGGGPTPLTLQIHITQFRNGFGPARIHTRTVVYEPSGAVVRDFENESMTMRGGNKTSRLVRIAQHNVQAIADSL